MLLASPSINFAPLVTIQEELTEAPLMVSGNKHHTMNRLDGFLCFVFRMGQTGHILNDLTHLTRSGFLLMVLVDVVGAGWHCHKSREGATVNRTLSAFGLVMLVTTWALLGGLVPAARLCSLLFNLPRCSDACCLDVLKTSVCVAHQVEQLTLCFPLCWYAVAAEHCPVWSHLVQGVALITALAIIALHDALVRLWLIHPVSSVRVRRVKWCFDPSDPFLLWLLV